MIRETGLNGYSRAQHNNEAGIKKPVQLALTPVFSGEISNLLI
jgi:hypothetical protein